MASYLVMKPSGAVRDPDSVRFIRDGFSWFALVVPLIWMLFHRMWLFAVLFLAAQFVVAFGSDLLGCPEAGSIVLLGMNLLVALESGMLRERNLLSGGWTTVAVLSADSIEDAETLYFHGLESQLTTTPPAPAAGRPPRNPWGGASLGPFESYGSV